MLMDIQNTLDSSSRHVLGSCVLPNKRNTQNSRDTFILAILDNAKNSDVVSALGNIKFSLHDCCEKAYKSLNVPDKIFQISTSTQNSHSEWITERQFRITGSRCYSVFTYSKNNWPEKARKYFWPKQFQTKETKHGVEYEVHARNKYMEFKSVYIQECGLVVAAKEPWMAYSPDGVIIENNLPTKLLEIKCPFNLTDVTVENVMTKCEKYLCMNDQKLQLKKKHQYYGQVQFGMAVLNIKQCDFVIYSSVSQSILIITVDYDAEFCHTLLSSLKQRYFEKMLHEICVNSP